MFTITAARGCFSNGQFSGFIEQLTREILVISRSVPVLDLQIFLYAPQQSQ
jgi:hypothetical protein